MSSKNDKEITIASFPLKQNIAKSIISKFEVNDEEVKQIMDMIYTKVSQQNISNKSFTALDKKHPFNHLLKILAFVGRDK